MDSKSLKTEYYVIYHVTEYTIEVLGRVLNDVEREVNQQGGEYECDDELRSAFTCLRHARSKLEEWVPYHQGYASDEYGNRLEE